MNNLDGKFFDIYLWVFPKSDKVIKIGHLTHEEATRLTNKWFEMNELHDYMLVLEDSTPFIKEANVDISIKTKEWLEGINSIEQL